MREPEADRAPEKKAGTSLEKATAFADKERLRGWGGWVFESFFKIFLHEAWNRTKFTVPLHREIYNLAAFCLDHRRRPPNAKFFSRDPETQRMHVVPCVSVPLHFRVPGSGGTINQPQISHARSAFLAAE